MSHKAAKRERKLYPHLSSKVRRQHDRLREEAMAKAVLIADSVVPTEPVSPQQRTQRSSMASRLQVAAMLAALQFPR